MKAAERSSGEGEDNEENEEKGTMCKERATCRPLRIPRRRRSSRREAAAALLIGWARRSSPLSAIHEHE